MRASPTTTRRGSSSTISLPTGVGSVEWVEVTFNAMHFSPGDLEVVLISPSGTRSVLAEPHLDHVRFAVQQLGLQYRANWGEAAEGTWTLQVRDRNGGGIGTWNSWDLTAYGSVDPGAGPHLISIIPNEGALLEGGEVLHVSPQELLLRFNEGQVIDPATLGAISITRAGAGRNVQRRQRDRLRQRSERRPAVRLHRDRREAERGDHPLRRDHAGRQVSDHDPRRGSRRLDEHRPAFRSTRGATWPSTTRWTSGPR